MPTNRTSRSENISRWSWALALLLAVVLSFLLLIDAFSVDYQVDPVVAGSVLGAIVALGGVSVAQRPFRKD